MANSKKHHHTFLKIGIALVSVVALSLVTVAILVTDFTDNTPSYYKEMKDVSTGDYLGEKAKRQALSCGPLDDYEYLFDEEGINRLMGTLTPHFAIPMVNITSIYLSIDSNDRIHAEAPFWALFYRSCAKLDGYLTYDDSVLTLRIEEIKANLLSSAFGIVDWVLSEKTIADIERSINDAGVHLTMEKQNKDIVVKMTNLGICKTIVSCCQDPSIGFLSAAIAAGLINSRTTKLVVNQAGLTGIIVKKSLL